MVHLAGYSSHILPRLSSFQSLRSEDVMSGRRTRGTDDRRNPGSYTAQTDRILPLRPLPPLCLSSFPSVPSLHSSIPRVAEASEMNGERREPDNSRDAAE